MTIASIELTFFRADRQSPVTDTAVERPLARAEGGALSDWPSEDGDE